VAAIQPLLEGWLAGVETTRLIRLDASADDPAYARALPNLLHRINELLGA